MFLTLATPTKKILFEDKATDLFVPAEKGELNILPGHAPLVSTLTTGVLRYKLEGEEKLTNVAISWGFLEVAGDKISVLAETAETEEEIDTTRAREAYKVSQERMNMAGLGENELEKYRRKMQRAQARLDAKEVN
tara:strand:+ start:19427 stop:19831 length:405 start_codon:yes stop_codon:yes gene_type:complete